MFQNPAAVKWALLILLQIYYHGLLCFSWIVFLFQLFIEAKYLTCSRWLYLSTFEKFEARFNLQAHRIFQKWIAIFTVMMSFFFVCKQLSMDLNIVHVLDHCSHALWKRKLFNHWKQTIPRRESSSSSHLTIFLAFTAYETFHDWFTFYSTWRQWKLEKNKLRAILFLFPTEGKGEMMSE